MMATQAYVNSDDFDDRFRHHFPRRSNDIALLVLKGHLLLEEGVNHLLQSPLDRPEAIEGANLRFHQKLCLIRALHQDRQLPTAKYSADQKAQTLWNDNHDYHNTGHNQFNLSH